MKNLTQLPWSGKGSKAKNDITLGRMHGGIMSKIGSMSLKNTSLFGVILALLLTLGVGEVYAFDLYVRGIGTWDANNNTHMVDRGSNTQSLYLSLTGNTSYSFKIADNSWGTYNYGGSGSPTLGTAYTLTSGGGNISFKPTATGVYLFSVNTSTWKLTITQVKPTTAAEANVVNGTNAMFYIQGYEGLNYLVNSSGTKASTTTPLAYTGYSYVNTAKTNLATYDRISNNPPGWTGDEATNIKTATGGELITRANAKTAAKTAATTASVTGDVLSISTTTDATTGVYGSLPLYIQYYVDNTFVGVTYNAATASYASISAGGATARASTYNVSSLTNGSHTLKTVLTDGIIYWVADQDNFTVAHVYSITYKDQGNVTYSGSNSASLPSSYTYGVGVTLVDGVKAGYDFGGWYTASDCSSGLTTSIGTSATGAKTYYAKWTASATNSLATSGGTGISSTSGDTNPVTLGNKYDISATVATGYTFSGWTASPVANGTFDDASSASTKVKVQNGSVTVTASATENKSTLTTSNHYDAGNPSYSAPSKSVSSIGIVTTSTITAATPSTGYTFAGWTLSSNLVVTSGNKDTDLSITVRTNGNGADATAQANYEEVLTSPYTLRGGSIFGGTAWEQTDLEFEKNSGESTTDIAYFKIPISTLWTEGTTGNYQFKIIKDGSTWCGLDAKGGVWDYYSNSGEQTLGVGSGDNICLKADIVGTYVIKIDYTTPASPKISIAWPPAVSWTAASVYSGEATLTATAVNIVSGKSLKYEVFAGATATGDAIATHNTTTSATTDSHDFSITPSFGANDISKQYTVKITYDGSQTATYTSVIGRKWDIYVQDNCSWGNIYNYNWDASDNHGFGGWPGTASSVYSGSWRTITLDGKYPNVILHGNNNQQTNDITASISTYGAGTFWNFAWTHDSDSKKYYNLNSVTISNPTVELTNYDVINTTQIYVKGNITNFGNDGNSAAEMQEVGFKVGETEYTTTCTDGSTFERYITGLTANTSYSVKAYATNLHGTGESAATAKTTRATGTYTIKVRSGVSDPVPYIYAFVWSDGGCGGSNTTANAAWPGVAMTLDITGTTYKWYSYTMSNVYSKFKISENTANDTYDFDAPLEDKCYWYHSSEAAQGDRMGTMDCPYTTPQLMIEETAGEEDFTYLEMSTSPTISKTVTLAAKSTYLFKIVYNAEWYGKASVNLSRASNSVSSVSAAVEDNMAITTDAAGDYTFTFTTPGTVTVTYPTAYTVTFGKGTGGSTISASATSAGGTLTSGDYVAAGDNVTFTQTASTGYTFAGWYDASTGGSAVATMGVNDNVLNSIGANATVYSRYTPNNYTVTFDATTNGGTCGTASKSVTFDDEYGELPTATRATKAFKGWFTLSSGGTQVTEETIVSTADDHTIYAQFEDIYSVTIDYKCGDAKLRTSSSTHASATALAPEITAPEIVGYTFSGWTGSNATFANASSATTTVNATAATTITATYTAIPTVYFKNNLNWDKVYVTFDCDWTTGTKNVPKNNGKPYFEMEQLGTSDIFSCVIPDDYVTSSYAGWSGNIAFDNKGFEASDNVGSHTGGFDAGEFLGRGDFDPSATMFIPYDGDSETRNGGTYYRTGCWMKYNSTDPGYKLYANTYREGSGGSAVTGTPVLLEAGIAGGFEFKATVSLGEANYTYGIMLHKEYTKNSNAIWYTNTGTIYASTTTLPWDFTTDGASENGTRCGLHTEATGNYEITVSFATGKPMVNVTYPVSTGDWRLVYKDRATWSNGAHSAAWQHPSRVIKAKADAEDIVSFYVSKAVGANATVELQKCTAIDPGTGAQTWVKQSDVDLSEITSTGIYNFKVTQNGSMEATVAFDGGYVGNFYIRTDASDGGWSNYKTSGTNTMTYSEYSLEHGGEFGPYSHYFMRYVTAGSNIKFCIANDYSECISDTIVGDTYTGEYIAASGNVRFMWYWETNKIGRAYISGSSIISHRFLVLEGDAKMFDENGDALDVSGLEANEMNFTDDQNWIYEATVQAQPGAQFKLTAKYNNKVQYFYGDEDETEQLLGGDVYSTTKYTIRIVYDFKTNRLIKAFIPSGTISEDLSIEADLMIIREHQEDAQQINFTGSGALSDVKTVYGAMKFNKWTVNGKEKTGGHALTGDSRYKRDLFYISFPFAVKLSDVFGFGTYGTHWIIEYYDGKGRAKNGFWADSDSYWKFVMPSQRSSFTLNAFEGYILALDLDEMTEGSSIWNNGVEDVYVYFPSSAAVKDIQATNRLITIDQKGYQCQIGPRFEGGDDRRLKDSYWHVIGVPSFANYNRDLTVTDGGTAIDWSDDNGEIDWGTPSLPYLYEWNSADNSLTVTTSATFNFKATYSYMVQYAGASIYWSAVNATPSSVVARKNDNHPTSAEFRLELLQGEEKADQTFVRLTDEEKVTTGFDFNYDLSKEMNSNRANIFTMITTTMSDGNTVTESAANCLPMNNQTTVVPVGVKIAAEGDYTFAIPEGTEGVGVTLIDRETGIRTSLSAVDYTVSLEEGTYNERFVLEISPIYNTPTEIEQSDVRDQKSDVRKLLIDGLLYIVRDNKVYDARGARVE